MAAAALPPPGGYRWEAKTCMLVPAGAGPLLGGTGQVSPLRGGTLLNLTRRPGSCTLEIGFDSEEVRSVLHRLEAEQQAALRQHLADATAKRLRVAYRSAFEERRSARFADVLRCTFYEGTSCLWTGPSRAANTVADLVPQVPCYAWLHFAGLHLEGGQATMRLAVAHLWAGAPRWGRFPFRTGLEVEGALQQSVPHLPGPPPAASALAYQKGGWLRQNVLFRVDGIVIDEHYQKITVSCSPSAALAALDRRQAEAVKGATTFYPLLKPAPGGGLGLQAKVHLGDGAAGGPVTRLWRTAHTPWDLGRDAALWRYREREAGQDSSRWDTMSDADRVAALQALHGGDRSGRPTVQAAPPQGLQGRRVWAVLVVRGVWRMDKGEEGVLAGHRAHFQDLWIQSDV
jgi:hypothetical protein